METRTHINYYRRLSGAAARTGKLKKEIVNKVRKNKIEGTCKKHTRTAKCSR